uniref:Telomerase reverse transcriptase n=1 Tax=Lygus hesperus TaxID=30085 RepID=A0A146LAR3_LYGHE
MDDYLLITPSMMVANAFVDTFLHVLPATTHLSIQPGKFFANFSARQLPEQTSTQWVPWNGLLLASLPTLQVCANYSKLLQQNLLHTYTCKRPKRSIKQILKYLVIPHCEYVTLNIEIVAWDTLVETVFQRS